MRCTDRYFVVAATIGLLLGPIAFVVVPFAMTGGGYYGYRHAEKKRTR